VIIRATFGPMDACFWIASEVLGLPLGYAVVPKWPETKYEPEARNERGLGSNRRKNASFF